MEKMGKIKIPELMLSLKRQAVTERKQPEGKFDVEIKIILSNKVK